MIDRFHFLLSSWCSQLDLSPLIAQGYNILPKIIKNEIVWLIYFYHQKLLNGIVTLNLFFFFSIRPSPGLLPALGPLERYMTPTLDAALLSSFIRPPLYLQATTAGYFLNYFWLFFFVFDHWHACTSMVEIRNNPAKVVGIQMVLRLKLRLFV